jgi:uncharacterized protein (DUF983 family)
MTNLMRPVGRSLVRGLARCCPACGIGRSFAGYLRVAVCCSHCGEALGLIRADDFPPYITMVIVGHLVVPALLLVEQRLAPPLWLQLAIWPALGLGLTLLLLPRIKGAVIGLMWALGLRGDERQ